MVLFLIYNRIEYVMDVNIKIYHMENVKLYFLPNIITLREEGKRP